MDIFENAVFLLSCGRVKIELFKNDSVDLQPIRARDLVPHVDAGVSYVDKKMRFKNIHIRVDVALLVIFEAPNLPNQGSKSRPMNCQ